MSARLFMFSVIAVAAAAPAAEPRQPTGQWVADFDVSQCIAYRNYGTQEDPLYLVLKAPPLGSAMQLVVMRKGGYMAPEQAEVAITFDGHPPFRTTILGFKPDQGKYRSYLVNLPPAAFAPFRSAKSLAIEGRGLLNERFALRSTAQLMQIVEQCIRQLRQEWNIGDTMPTAGERGQPPANPRLREPARGNSGACSTATITPALLSRMGTRAPLRSQC